MNNNIDKYLKKKKKQSSNNKIPYILNFTKRFLICVILFLLCLIAIKNNPNLKEKITTVLYENNISFTGIKNFYNKYFGGVVPLENISYETEQVFNEELVYNNYSKYLDGVSLEVTNNYVVPVIESGMVVYVGEKEGYGNVVIIQGMDGVDIWYGNLLTTSVKLYDYLEQGNIVGEVNNNTLYLVYAQNGKFLDYENYLKK